MLARTYYILYIALLLLLSGCSKDSPVVDVVEGKAITFSPTTMDVSESVRSTRANPTLGRGFVLCGYKKLTGSDAQQYIFPRYDVAYVGGLYDYQSPTQPLVYWDVQAEAYRFWGIAGDHENIKEEGNVIQMKNIMLQVEEPMTYPKFSSLYLRKSPITFEVVSLEFKRPVAKLCLKFYNERPIREGRVINITDISLAPVPYAPSPKAGAIWNDGIVQVTYPLTGEAEQVEVLNNTSTRSHLSFLDVALDALHGSSIDNAVTALIPGFDGDFSLPDIPGESLAPSTRAGDDTHPDHYYPLPMGTKNPDFVLHLKLDGVQREVIIPENYMHWEANRSYTYVIKITNHGEAVLHDARIEGWTAGGSQDDEFNNW